jgi:hypothetical protein
VSNPTSGIRPTDPNDPTGGQHAAGPRDWDDDFDDYTETKTFFRTSEFWFGVLGVVGVLLAAHIEGTDSMTRDDGWRYATAILIGYMLSRGLAKAGTRESDRG